MFFTPTDSSQNHASLQNMVGTNWKSKTAAAVLSIVVSSGTILPLPAGRMLPVSNAACISFAGETKVDNSLTMNGMLYNSAMIKSLNRINLIRKLPDNWNENGAQHFSAQLIDEARELVSLLHVQPIIMPTACDSIQMEYDNSIGDYLEFELTEGKHIKMFSYSHDGIADIKEIDFMEVNGAVSHFYEQ